MAALVSLLSVVTLSLLINRVATVALTQTGISRQLAAFQSRSAFTGAGFTTDEAESVVTHPVRRRIIMLLMLLGNVGIVTTMSSLLLTFTNSVGFGEWAFRLALLAIGLGILWMLATSKWIDFYLSRLISWALSHWTRLDVRDYASLLHLSGEYTVTQLDVKPGDWLADRELTDLNLRQEGISVLGIHRKNRRYLGAPKADTCIRPGDTLILYGRLSLLNELDDRRSDWQGEHAHHQAVADQQQILWEQDREEREDDRQNRP
ncbi:TrkA C-terminal domain-containing protein [Lyngbya sp. CCY1209]|uniref:TrkA C-terminal domain-containing protein n=1 Tax=Lyngbya sp. CCY1209 TaxID=2886103 RepID=UPI002D2009BC|nr:TrkA C-terminal domain-containing protein [Lyngbya sp. CCY1209]MEB3887343.1 hypothetical protein [Lyngbya sp. CCY1209]